MERIVEIQMRRVERRLAERGISLELTSEARAFLAAEGYDPVYGARPLRRAIEKRLLNPLAEHVLRGAFGEGARVTADVAPDRGGLAFRAAA
jgi:ATP-dependent Clp protease ATP-binding subunit ClpB